MTVPVASKETSANNDGPKLSLEEELARAMGGLKKIKKREVKEKPKQLSPRDLLRQQIRIRHANLKMHEDESDSDSEKSQDSFSI